MGIVTTDNKYYSDIADAIREKKGESTLYLPSEMAPAILAIEGNSGYTVTVRNCGANATVTAKHGTTQETAKADAEGTAIFEKLDKGVWFFTSPSRENAVAEILGNTNLDFDAEVFNPTPNGLIICTTPSGSTVTATNGTTTFKAEKTLMGENEIHVISVKPEAFSANPITVTCIEEDGISTTRDAIVDSKKDVELSFDNFYLIKGGNTLVPFTSVGLRWDSNSSAALTAPTITVEEGRSISASITGAFKSGVYRTTSTVNTGRYTRIVVEGEFYNASTNPEFVNLSCWSKVPTYISADVIARADVPVKQITVRREIAIPAERNIVIGFAIVNTSEVSSTGKSYFKINSLRLE